MSSTIDAVLRLAQLTDADRQIVLAYLTGLHGSDAMNDAIDEALASREVHRSRAALTDLRETIARDIEALWAAPRATNVEVLRRAARIARGDAIDEAL